MSLPLLSQVLAPRLSTLRRYGVLLLLSVTGHAGAATVADLYQATVRVQDRSEQTRLKAYSNALAAVLTRISGRRDVSATVAGAGDAQRYVRSYSYNGTGQLEVGFDDSAINQIIERNGLPLWGRERPLTLVVLPDALQGTREARSVFEQAAKLRGVPVVWSSDTTEHLGTLSLAQLQELAAKSDAVAILLARTVPDAVSAANVRWQFVFNGSSQESRGAMDEGPMLAADTLARYYAVSTKETMKLALDVAGIGTVNAYADSLNFLSGLPQVREVKVDSVQGEMVRFRLELRGNADSLRRALALDQRLVEQTMPAVDAGILSYRYGR